MGISEQDLLALAQRVAEKAAATARRMRTEAITEVSTKSTATDVVTAADRAVERQIMAAVQEERPGDAFLGEEFGAVGTGECLREPPEVRSVAGQVRWIVDPIDGTVNYLYGLPDYAVSIAAEVDGVVVVGVVHHAVYGTVWTALRGQGAWRDGVKLTGSPAIDLSQALVATGFGYAASRREHQGRVVAAVLPKVRDIRRRGAASIDLCAAADGTVDAYFEKGLAPWDLAAGGLVATEAGLLVTGLSGAAAGPNMVLAAPPALHAPLHALLAELDAAGGP